MKEAAIISIVTALLASPAQAAEWQDVRPGTFVGARLTIGGKGGARPRAALAIAPTETRTSHDGYSSMKIGEGLAFNLAPGAKPTLTLAGVRADTVLGFRSGPIIDQGGRQGMSDGAKVAVGVGAAVLVGLGVGYLVLSNRCTECDQ